MEDNVTDSMVDQSQSHIDNTEQDESVISSRGPGSSTNKNPPNSG